MVLNEDYDNDPYVAEGKQISWNLLILQKISNIASTISWEMRNVKSREILAFNAWILELRITFKKNNAFYLFIFYCK